MLLLLVADWQITMSIQEKSRFKKNEIYLPTNKSLLIQNS